MSDVQGRSGQVGKPDLQTALAAEHTPEAVAARIAADPVVAYLRDFIYGAIDGCVTTFAVVAGAMGAELSSGIVLILGFANLIADGFSMSVSNFLGTQADRQLLHRARRIEENHIQEIPDGEIEEIREIFRQKGFEGDLLERVVQVITGNRRLWVDTMLREEWGLALVGPSPWKAAAVTFAAFVLVGLVPVAPFLVFHFLGVRPATGFAVSSVLTAAAFFGIGAMKARYVAESWLRAGGETLAMGGGAAVLAFVVGVLLRGLAG